MNVIGLGNCGCNIAEKFRQYPQYDLYLFDTEKREGGFLIEERGSHKEYEDHFNVQVRPKHSETLFFVSTSGTTAGASLRILEQFKETKIRVILIIPEEDQLYDQYSLQHKLIFNALQDYARSGMFKDIVLISNEKLESSISGLTFMNKFDKINDVISYSIHMLNYFENTKPITATKFSSMERNRILSIGSYDFENNSENDYFLLDNQNEFWYYMSIDKKRLEEDVNLIPLIKGNFKEKKNFCYKIYPNESGYNFGLVVKRTHFHQGTKLGEKDEV